MEDAPELERFPAVVRWRARHPYEVWTADGFDSRWTNEIAGAQRVVRLADEGWQEIVMRDGAGREYGVWESKRIANGYATLPKVERHPDILDSRAAMEGK